MALSVQSQSQPFAATQVYLVTGTVGDAITASIDDQTVSKVSPTSATMTAAGVQFTVSRVGTIGGACTLTFADTTSGESEPVTVNHAGDPSATPNPISGQVGDSIAVAVSETNDPNAFATLSVDDTTIAQITSSSNAEGQAALQISLLANGTTALEIDDGHGGTLTVQILVGAAAPVKNVVVAAGEAVIGGTVVPIASGIVALQDTTSGYNGPGNYTISLTSSGTFVVTNGIPPAESSTQINIAKALLTTSGALFLSDARTLQVTTDAVNRTIMAQPNVDGSYVAGGVVTTRTLGADVLAMFSSTTSGDSEPQNPHQGQTFYNTTTNVFEIFESGKWVVIATVGASAALAGLSDVSISAAADGQVLAWSASASKWENIALPADADALAALSDVSISSPAPSDGQVLVYSASAAKWVNGTASALATTHYLPLVNGDLPGPSLMSDGNGQTIGVPV